MKFPFVSRTNFDALQHQCVQMFNTLESITSSAYFDETRSRYKSYASQVSELAEMYECKATWGNQIARNVIDVRAAFIIANGIQVTGEKRELEFIKAFIAHNNLDEEVPQNLAREAEIEGKFLARLIPNAEAAGVKRRGMIEMRFVPWTAHKYTIVAKADDYNVFERAKYQVNQTGKDVNLDPSEFVYARFGGRTHKVNDTPPKIGGAIHEIKNLDRALQDWRAINHYFASPTPYFKCETKEQAQAMQKSLGDIQWKIGKVLCGTADFSMVGIDDAGWESLKEEIITQAKIISGTTGVPVHFLGLPDLMSNRATAENLMELVSASTLKERRIWVGAYEEMFSKALAMANEHFQGGFDSKAVEVSIPFITQAHMDELSATWLPLYTSSAISLETFLSKVPDVDPVEEVKRVEDRKKNFLRPVFEGAQ